MKNLLTKSLLLIIINLFFTAASTQTLKTTEESYQYRHFSTKDGLPSNTIFNVLQDEHNLAWIGTDDGLARFDGNSFKVYKHNPYDSNSLSSNYITNLVKDSKNRLWVGTDYGVDMYDEVHDNFKIFIPKKGKAESSIAAKCSQIAEDNDHNIWIGTNDGLYIIDADLSEIKEYHFKTIITDSIYINKMLSICNGENSSVYVSSDRGIFLINRKNKTEFSGNYNPGQNKLLNEKEVGYLFNDKKETNGFSFTYTTPKKIKLYNIKTNTVIDAEKYFHFKEQEHKVFTPFYYDHDNNLWVCGWEGILYKVDTVTHNLQNFKHELDNPQSVVSNTIFCVTQDKQNNYWIGTDKGFDIMTVHASYFTSVHNSDSANISFHANVSDLLKDRYGNIWIATYGDDGLFKWNPITGEEERFHKEQWNMNQYDEIWKIKEDANGKIWIGRQCGYSVLDPQTKKMSNFFLLEKKLSTAKMQYYFIGTIIFQDKDRNMWLGTNRGLGKIDPHTDSVAKWYMYDANDPGSLPSNKVYAITQDSSGQLWLGCYYGGLVKFDPVTGKSKTYEAESGKKNTLVSNYITSLKSISDSELIIITMGGVSIFNPITETFRNYYTVDGLPSDAIKDCYEDANKNLWFSTRKGICKLNRSTQIFTSLTTEDGIINDNETGSFLSLSDSLVLISYNNVLLSFNPLNEGIIPGLPHVFFTAFKKFNSVIYNTYQLDTLKKINLTYKDNYFSLDYSITDFSNTNKALFAYRVDGYDSTWIKTGNNHTATFTNLPPGDYTVEVRATLDHIHWGNPSKIQLSIIPPFWNTWWFYLLITLFFIALLTAIFFITLRIKLQRVIAMQKVRNRIAGDLHDDIGSALSSISLMSELAKEKSPESLTLITRISESTASIQENMSDIVWSVNPKNDNFENVLQRMNQFAEEILDAKNMQFDFKSKHSSMPVKLTMEQRKNFYLFFKEAINNAAKYSEAKNITVIIDQTGNQINMTISDNGKGFDTGKIYNGNGMANLKKRAAELQADFEINSVLQEGTTVTLKFKIT